MSGESRSARKFHSDLFVEIVLLVALAAYLILAQNQGVGDDLTFTVIGAGLMALISYWTLTTVRDGLELVAIKMKRLHH
ncbi:hypothetical protein J2887_20035 [Marinobacter sp. CA1]|nr:hypothetical protein J2887_20035 [Marinobacter sp. CA1]